MKIDQEITDALRQAISHYGNILQLAQRIGVAHSTIIFWLNGKTSKINSILWEQRVFPELRKYLAADKISQYTASLRENNINHYSTERKHSKIHPEEQKELPPQMPEQHPLVPLLSFLELEKFQPMLEPVEKFIRNKNAKMISFVQAQKNNCFAVSVDQDHAGYFPEGVNLLAVCGNDLYPESNDIVIVRFRSSGKIAICRYFRSESGSIDLYDLQAGTDALCKNISSASDLLLWICPVIEANCIYRDLRKTESAE